MDADSPLVSRLSGTDPTTGGEVVSNIAAGGLNCGALPQLGVGIVLQCHDASIPAAEIAFDCAVVAFEEQFMKNQDQHAVLNAAGTKVGGMQKNGDAYKAVKY